MLCVSLFPVHGGYSSWSNWDTCTQSCGNGTQYRYRTCTEPARAFGGDNCTVIGPANDQQDCNTQPCPGESFVIVDGVLVFDS